MTISVEGAELYCSVHGSGPVCLVPSAIGTAPYERQMAPRLSDHLTMVYVDLRGGGRSTGRAADLTFDRFAADVDGIRAALGVDRVALLGHSILGMLALECGRRRPDRVSHVVTVGTPPHGDMNALGARSAAFFEADADDDRKRRMRDNLAALPPEPSPGEFLLAQTPMRFHDPTIDAAPLFAGAVPRPELLMHISGTLAPRGPSPPTPPPWRCLCSSPTAARTTPCPTTCGTASRPPCPTPPSTCSRPAGTSRSSRSPSGSPPSSPNGWPAALRGRTDRAVAGNER